MSQASSLQGRLARNVSIMGISVGVTMLIALALRMVLPRVFGPEKMGTFYFAESFSNLFFAFLPLGITTYINRTIPARPEHTKEILNTIISLQLIAATFIGLLLWGTLAWSGRDSHTTGVTLLMGVYAAILIFQKSIFHTIFMAHEEVSLISRLNVVVKAILVCSCLFVLWIHPSLYLIAAMHLLSELCGLGYLLWRSKQKGYFAGPPEIAKVKTVLKISLPFYLAGVLNGVYSEIDTTMLAHFANTKEVGYFGAAYRLIGVFLMLVPIMHNAVTPVLSKAFSAADGSFQILAQQILKFLLIASLPLSVGLILFGDHIALILYGESFAPSFKVLCFLSPVLTMMYLNTYMGICLNLTSSGRKLALIFVFGILLNIVLDYLLIPVGLSWRSEGGAALAVSFSTFLCEVYTFLAMAWLFPGQIFQKSTIYGCFVIFLPCWLGMAFYEQLVGLGLGYRILLALAVPVYALLTRVVTLEECKNVLTLFRLWRGGPQ